MRNHTAGWSSMYLSKQPAGLKLTSMSGKQTFNEATITGSTVGQRTITIDTRTIISWALLSLLNNIYLVTKIHVFMYLKDIIRDIIRGGKYMFNEILEKYNDFRKAKVPFDIWSKK